MVFVSLVTLSVVFKIHKATLSKCMVWITHVLLLTKQQNNYLNKAE